MVEYPQIRNVEAFPAEESNGETFILFDPAGIADSAVSLSRAAMFVVSLMDGSRTIPDIERDFLQHTGQIIPRQHLEHLVSQLDQALYLNSSAFKQHMQACIDAYHAAPARVSELDRFAADSPAHLTKMLEDILTSNGDNPEASADGQLCGLIAPHLDLERGTRAYAAAYSALIDQPAPQRVIILGTNHFGQGSGPVATTKNFQTPLGTTATDAAFIRTLEQRLGHPLCVNEFDHQREHSIEFQVVFLQHLLGPESFSIVPVLCQDPCGPTGTQPYDGQGADLADFASELAKLIAEQDERTLIVAGADLSHVGYRFGDEQDLDEAFLEQVRQQDHAAIEAISTGDAEAFVQTLRSSGNGTRICGTGCIYALLASLSDARIQQRCYHQAIDRPTGTGVTCMAAAFWQ